VLLLEILLKLLLPPLVGFPDLPQLRLVLLSELRLLLCELPLQARLLLVDLGPDLLLRLGEPHGRTGRGRSYGRRRGAFCLLFRLAIQNKFFLARLSEQGITWLRELHLWHV